MLNLQKTFDEDLKVKSFVSVRSNALSRKSSHISVNSHESKTILVKQALQPSIREILADTPSKGGECAKFMEKSKEAWNVQNYERSIEYLLHGLQMCILEHPSNYF